MYKVAAFFQSRFSVSEPTIETSSFKEPAHSPSIAISLTANSKPQLGYNGGYSSIERHTSASRLSKIWTRFGRRPQEDVSVYDDENLSGGLSDSKFESSVPSLGVANKPSRAHPSRRHTINLLKSEDEDSMSAAYCDQVSLLSNTSTEFGQPMVRSRHRTFLQRKSRPPLIKTSSDSNIDWYYPSTPSPVEVEISVEVVSRPAVPSACPVPEENKTTLEQGSSRDENSSQKDIRKFNPFDLAFAETSMGEIKETLSTRRKNKSRASLPNISTDFETIQSPPKIETLVARPLTVNTSDVNIPDLARMPKDSSMVGRKSGQRKANSTMQAEAVSNSMRKNSLGSIARYHNEEDVDADGISNIPSSCSLIWSDVPESPMIPSAPPPSPWVIHTNEGGDGKEVSPSVQPNPWISMSSTFPMSSPTSTVPPQFFGQHIQQHSAAKAAFPSPLGMPRRGSLLGIEAMDSPSLETLPTAPPCTPCTPFPE